MKFMFASNGAKDKNVEAIYRVVVAGDVDKSDRFVRN